jgi:hypothetical protein
MLREIFDRCLDAGNVAGARQAQAMLREHLRLEAEAAACGPVASRQPTAGEVAARVLAPGLLEKLTDAQKAEITAPDTSVLAGAIRHEALARGFRRKGDVAGARHCQTRARDLRGWARRSQRVPCTRARGAGRPARRSTTRSTRAGPDGEGEEHPPALAGPLTHTRRRS